MKKRMLSLALAAVTLISSLGGYAFAKEDVPAMATKESQIQQSKTAVETAGESEKTSEAQTENKGTEIKETDGEPKLIVSFEPADYEAEIGFKDYMQKGGEDYLISQLPDTVTAVYEDKSIGEVEASWLPEKRLVQRAAESMFIILIHQSMRCLKLSTVQIHQRLCFMPKHQKNGLWMVLPLWLPV